MTTSTSMGCQAADVGVGSAKRKVAGKDNKPTQVDASPGDVNATEPPADEAANANPTSPPASPATSPGGGAGAALPLPPSISFDTGSDQAMASDKPLVECDGGQPQGQRACTVEATQHVDVPRAVRETGGTWELRRVFDAPSDTVPNIESAPPVALAAGAPAFDVTTEGSDFQVVLFRDPSGQVVDAQWHQSRCAAARPARSDVVRDVPATYPTIQAAIDAAEPGDTVRVAAGVYSETLTLEPQITLLGAGPDETILDAAGQVTKLVDVTGAFGASVIGFRFRNVGMGGSCSSPADPLACAGDHYPVALYADGHADDENGSCHVSTFFAAHNVFEGNAYGIMAYHRVQAALFDNVFVGNTNALVVNYAADAFALVENNVFAATNVIDIASSSARVFAAHNAFDGALDCAIGFIQRGRYTCNAFTGAITCDALTPGDVGNVDFAAADAAEAAVAAGCVAAPGDAGTVRWFDFAGETGRKFRE